MQIKELSGGVSSFGECLNGKRRIMTYGAGSLADDIERILKEQGYQVDYRIVDNLYFVGGGRKYIAGRRPLFFLRNCAHRMILRRMWSYGQSALQRNCIIA